MHTTLTSVLVRCQFAHASRTSTLVHIYYCINLQLTHMFLRIQKFQGTRAPFIYHYRMNVAK